MRFCADSANSAPEKRCFLSSPMENCYRERRDRSIALERLAELVNLLPAVSLPMTAAETYGIVRADLEKKGVMIGTMTCGSQSMLSHRH